MTNNEIPGMTEEQKKSRKDRLGYFLLIIVAFGAIVMLEPYISVGLYIPLIGIALFAMGSYAIYKLLLNISESMSEAMMNAGKNNSTRLDILSKKK